MARKLEFEIAGKSNVDPAVNQARNSINKLKSDISKAFDFKGALTSAFLGAFGASVLLDKSIQSITESFKYLADIADKSAKAGVSADEFDKLAFAAEDAGVSTQVLAKALRELRFLLKDAQTDTEKMKVLTEGLGFTEEQVRNNQVKTIDIYVRAAKGLKGLQTDTEKLAYVSGLFSDKVANDMLPVLEAIANDDSLFKGLVSMSEASAKSADEMDRNMKKVEHNYKIYISNMTIATIEFFNFLESKGGVIGKIFNTIGTAIGMPHGVDYFGLAKAAANVSTPSATKVNDNAKVNAEAIIKAGQKSQDTSGEKKNTISNSFSPENGPTGGVIGVGNNAQTLAMQEQVDLLKQIRDALNRGSSVVTTDFTKPDFIPHKQLQFK